MVVLVVPWLFQIMQEIDENKIKIYEFPDVEEEEESKENKKLPMVSMQPALSRPVPYQIEGHLQI